MTVRKLRSSWWVDFRAEGKRYRKKSPENSPTGARAYEKVLRQKLARGESLEKPTLPKEVMTFSQFAEKWMKMYVMINNKSSEQKTKAKILRLHILPWFGNTQLDAISAFKIEEFKASRQERGLSAKTINNHLTILRKCLNTAVEWGELSISPKISLLHTLPTRRDFISVEEGVRLEMATNDPVWRAMILLALRTGMRFCELSGLQWLDVDMENNIISVRRGIVSGEVTSPKTHKERLVAFPKSVKDALSALSGRDGFVFSRRPGFHVSYNGAIKALRLICERAGLRRIGWHTLRHGCASQLGMLRGTLLEAQKLLGHSHLATTELYTHVMNKTLHEAVATLDAAAIKVKIGNPQATSLNIGVGQLVRR